MNDAFSIKLLTLLVFNLTFIALLTLIFFVSKSLIKLYLEKRHRVLGYKFRTRIVAIFVIITLIPSVLLFFMAGGLITTYVDRWLNPQIKLPIENAFELAAMLYDREKERTLKEARDVLNGRNPVSGFQIKRLSDNPEDASETIRNGFDGREGTEVISTSGGDIIRAVVPVTRAGRVRGVLIAEQVLPEKVVTQAEKIRSTYANYFSLYRWRLPIKINYLLALGFFTLLIVFLALWVALRISRGITDPIQRLAIATDTISKGNLDIQIDLKRDDEIGLLVNSFNRMVKELRESKESLQKAYLDADRRRLSLQNIIENIDSGVISLDENRQVITINTTAARILRVEQSEVSGRDYTCLLDNIESEELVEFLKGIRLSEFTSTSRQIKVNISGRGIILRIFITQLRDTNNKSLGLLVVFEDITELLKAQQALAWQEVARRITHEIKNPLTPIKLSTERLLRKWKQQDKDFGRVIENSTETIIREVTSLQQMVDEFSRLGRMPHIRKAPADINDLILEAVSLYSHIERGIEFRTDGTIQPIEVDREQFKRVIVNLLDNAISATKDGGTVTIGSSFNPRSKTVTIEVEDTGIGIRDEDKAKLFLPHFSTKKEGTGLGLAIVHRIITEHGGTISVRDNKDRGTIFSIELPA